jgi:DNA-binding IclR family transcriptional regulator
VPGSRAVAVPICLADGRTVAGLAIATITERLPDARVQGVVEQMRARARLIGAQAAELARRKSARRG